MLRFGKLTAIIVLILALGSPAYYLWFKCEERDALMELRPDEVSTY